MPSPYIPHFPRASDIEPVHQDGLEPTFPHCQTLRMFLQVKHSEMCTDGNPDYLTGRMPSVADPVIIRPAPRRRYVFWNLQARHVHVSSAIPSVFVTIVYEEHNW